MTLGEFLTALEGTRGRFAWAGSEGHGSLLRGFSPEDAGGAPFCPLTAVCYQCTGEWVATYSAARAGRLLGLAEADTCDIIDAADSASSRALVLRRALLRAVGVGL